MSILWSYPCYRGRDISDYKDADSTVHRIKPVCLKDIEVTSWLVSADDFSSRVARGANERVSAANE